MRAKPGNEGRSIASFVNPLEFRFFLASLKEVSSDKELYSLCLNIGYNMKHLTKAVKLERSSKGDQEGVINADAFLDLFNENFHMLLGSFAKRSKARKHINKRPIIVKDDDIRKI